jgi:hypothetical protein
MTKALNIQYKKRRELDTIAWDRCIESSDNGVIYAQSEWLDGMCSDWDGLVLNNYEAVMPLVWRKKWGVYYLYYPPFCAALGLFGNHLTAAIVEAFLQAIPEKFRYWDFPLNAGNNFRLEKFALQQRANYILSLRHDYPTIYGAYRQNLKRNIRKCADLHYYVDKGFPVAEVIALARSYSIPGLIDHETYTRFEKLYNRMASKQAAVTYGVRNQQGVLLASCVFLFSTKRAYYILVGNHPDGKTAGASHALIDAFIKDHAGLDLTLDFEGSDIRNLAFFYSSYGAIEEHYPVIKLNRLPAFLKWLKK